MKHLFLTIAAAVLAVNVNAAPASGPAPDFTAKSLAGPNVKLSELKGKVVLVNFWASWCGPCRQEMPILDALAKANKDSGLVVLGVNQDEDSDERDAFLKDNGVSFPILDDSKNEIAKAYKSPAQPSSFFVDRKGNIAHVHQGFKAGDDAAYANTIKELLAK